MRPGRLERLRRLTAPAMSLTLGELGILLSSAILLTVIMFLPQIRGDQLPDFRPLETQVRKTQFFAFLDPIVADVSADVTEERLFIFETADQIEGGTNPSWLTRRKVDRMARYYEIETEDADLATEVLPALQQRVDIVPRSLVLVQAAKESGWGTSRFALQGNNLFGQRCYSRGCGIAPAGIQPGAEFGVATYGSVNASVASYVRNLNTHPQYEEFRRQRRALRDAEVTLTGIALADSLVDYSERGEEYVAEIKVLIRQNGLESDD